jgi:hypothetical protein
VVNKSLPIEKLRKHVVPFAGVAGFSNCHLGSKSYQTSCTRGTRVSTWRAWRATGMTGRRRHSPQALAAAGTRRRHSPFRLPHAKISGPQGGVKLAGGLNNFWQSSNLAVQNGFISRSGLEYNFWSFATLSLYRYSCVCTYCTNSRARRRWY